MRPGIRVFVWVLNITVAVSLLVYLMGPVLFASVAYPLPEKYRFWVAKYALENNLNPNLLAALIMVESGWKENARSGVGAIGLTQFMPATAISMAKREGVSPFSPSDLVGNPELAIRFGAIYLRDGITIYGNETFALIRYNGGGGAVNAYRAGYPIQATVSYAKKIQNIKVAYDKIYGEWWKTAVDTNGTVNQAGFKVEPKRDVGLIRVIPLSEFWRNLLFSSDAKNDSTDTSNLNNFWQNLLPES